MEIKGISFIEDWKKVFGALHIDIAKFSDVLDCTKDGTLMFCIIEDELLIKFVEVDNKLIKSL